MIISVIGAGSHFTVNLLRSLFQSSSPDAHSFKFMDTRQEALDGISNVIDAFNASSGYHVRYSTHTDRHEALEGADHVLVAFAVDFPDAFLRTSGVMRDAGISFVEGETATPGALLATMRTLPVLLEVVADVKQVADGAWVHIINNPMPRLVRGVIDSGYDRVVGHCHGTVHERNFLSKLLDVPSEDIELGVIGVNHFHLVQTATDRRDGSDLLDRLPAVSGEKLDFWRSTEFTMWKLFEELGDLIGHGIWHNYDYLPYANVRMFRNSHLATWPEYALTLQALRGAGKREADSRFTSTEVVNEYLAQREPEQMFAVMAALSGITEPYRFWSGNLPNGDLVPQLPAAAVLEAPALVSENLITLEAPRLPVPEYFLSWINQHTTVQELTVRAITEQSRALAIGAIVADASFRDSIWAPGQLLDAMLAVNEGLVPPLQ